MKYIVSNEWPRERLSKLSDALWNQIDHDYHNFLDGEGKEVIRIPFRSDLCLGTMTETFVVCDVSNELPEEFVAVVSFKEDSIRVEDTD